MPVAQTEDARGAPDGSRLIDRVARFVGGAGDNADARRMAAAAFVIRVMSAAIAYVSQIVMARWMGGFEFGVYVSVWVWVLLLGHFSNLGLASAAQRFVPFFTGSDDDAGLRGYLGGARLIGLAAGTLVAALGLAFLWRFGHLVATPLLIPLALACLCLPLYVLTDIQDGVARAYNWTDLALGPPYLLRPILILAAMTASHFAGLPTNAVTAMACAVIATWGAGAIQFVALSMRLRTRVSQGPARREPIRWLAVSLPILLVEGFYLLLTYIDVVLLKHLRSPEEVAIYWAAVKTLALVSFVYFSVGAAAAHRFSALHASGDRDGLAELLRQTTRWTFFPSLAATALILALGKPFLMLFGPEFVAGYPAMFLVAVGLLARSAVGPSERFLSMSGRQTLCALIYATSFGFALALGLALIPTWGLIGAAAATATALCLESVLLFAAVRMSLRVGLAGPRRPAPAAP